MLDHVRDSTEVIGEIRQLRGMVEQLLKAKPDHWYTLEGAASFFDDVSSARLRELCDQRLLRHEVWPGRGGKQVVHIPSSELRRVPDALRTLRRMQQEGRRP